MFYYFVFVFYALFVYKAFRPFTVQYYLADCVRFIPRLTLSNLQTNWTWAQHSQKGTYSYVGNLLYFQPLCHPVFGTEAAAPPPKEPTRTFVIITTVKYP